jgi:uncharacterized membrane protein
MNSMWVKIALAVSLALNLFVIGAGVGAEFQRHRMVQMRVAPVPGNPMMRAGDGLPPDQREAYRMRMRQAGLANQPLLAANRAARDKVADAFSAPTFDADAATRALAASRDAENTARAQLENAVVEFAKGLTLDQRKVLAEGLRQPPQGGRGGRGGRRGGGMGGFGRGDFGPGGPGPSGDGSPPGR